MFLIFVLVCVRLKLLAPPALLLLVLGPLFLATGFSGLYYFSFLWDLEYAFDSYENIQVILTLASSLGLLFYLLHVVGELLGKLKPVVPSVFGGVALLVGSVLTYSWFIYSLWKIE